jgi:hypothetical protein
VIDVNRKVIFEYPIEIRREYMEVIESDTIQGINEVAAFKKKRNLTFERLSDTKEGHVYIDDLSISRLSVTV